MESIRLSQRNSFQQLSCTNPLAFGFFLIFFLIYLFLEWERDGERKGEKYQCVVTSHTPLLGTWPTTQACALTGNGASDPLVCILVLSPMSHTSWGMGISF